MTCTNEITHLGLEGTDGLGHGCLSGSCLLSLDRSDTATVQTSGGSGGYDGGGDRKGKENDRQSDFHDSILGGTEETLEDGVTVFISLGRNKTSTTNGIYRRCDRNVCLRAAQILSIW